MRVNNVLLAELSCVIGNAFRKARSYIETAVNMSNETDGTDQGRPDVGAV